MVCLALAMGLMVERRMFPLIFRLSSPLFCCNSTSWGCDWKVSSNTTPPSSGKRKPGATCGDLASSAWRSASSSLSSATASGAGLPAARSFSNLSVAAQSPMELVTFALVFGHKLVGTVFQDEPLGELLSRGGGCRQQEDRDSRQRNDQDAMKRAHSLIYWMPPAAAQCTPGRCFHRR